MDCLFCKIIAADIPSKKLYEDEEIFAFYDISPIAPVHILIVPKKHISSSNDINEDNVEIVAKIFKVIPFLAKQLGLKDGYRVITNCGKDAGQTVHHLHFHLLGGKTMNWEC